MKWASFPSLRGGVKTMCSFIFFSAYILSAWLDGIYICIHLCSYDMECCKGPKSSLGLLLVSNTSPEGHLFLLHRLIFPVFEFHILELYSKYSFTCCQTRSFNQEKIGSQTKLYFSSTRGSQTLGFLTIL